MIFDKNREPVAKNVRKACGTVTLRISDYFNIREEQGAWLPGITDQQVSELRTARALVYDARGRAKAKDMVAVRLRLSKAGSSNVF